MYFSSINCHNWPWYLESNRIRDKRRENPINTISNRKFNQEVVFGDMPQGYAIFVTKATNISKDYSRYVKLKLTGVNNT